jgi:Tol biopolymer transport system component
LKLAAGFRLGPYEITAPLGAGGMGEVYRARDHRLGRDVAIKVLPAEVAADPDRLRRFEQEARAASALNHPNLLTIYDVGEDAAQPYLVTELLEGRTLREWIDSAERLPPARVLDWGAQIAGGLAAAHERGIVHRDLKPENLFVTRDDRVKILDFGLAKLLQSESAPGSLAQATTIARATGTGIILGTAGYMAPEQVRGAAVDARTDLFALGCVLYELLGGARAFHRESAIETLNAILKEEPRPLGELASGMPVSVVRIVERCLAKEPASRFQSARDLAFALESVTAGAAGSGLVAAPWAPAQRRPVFRLAAAAIAGLLVLLGAFAGTRWAGRASAAPFALQRLTFERGQISGARFVPGSGDVALTASWGVERPSLYLKRADSIPSAALQTADARLLAISSRGELALQLHSRASGPFIWVGTLARQTLGAGAPRELVENVVVADWRPEADELAIVVEAGDSQRVEFPPGKQLYTTGGWVGRIRFSPDGALLAFFDHPARTVMGGNLIVLDVANGEKRSFAVDPDGADLLGLAWRPDGREIWYGDTLGRLRAVDLAGHLRPLANFPLAVDVQDVAPDGGLLVSMVDRRQGILVDEGTSAPREVSWLQWSSAFDLTRAGDRLLFTEFTDRWAGPGRAALRSTAGGPVTELADGFAFDLSPDEKSALLVRFSGETSRALLVPTGAGTPRELENGPIVSYDDGCFAPDGSWLLFVGRTATSGARLFKQRVDSGPPRQLSDEAIGFGQPSISPDGMRIAFSGADGSLRIMPVSGGASTIEKGMSGAATKIWSADGRTLLVRELGGPDIPVRRLDLATGTATAVRFFHPSDPIGVGFLGPVLTTPDERIWVYTYLRELATLYVVRGIAAGG